MSDDKIPKNNSFNNLNNFQNIDHSLSEIDKKNKMVYIINSLNNKNLNYCPTCKTKNMPSEVYLTFDLIFCSKKCRSKLCDGIDIEELTKFRNSEILKKF
jgi:hypothetical protein